MLRFHTSRSSAFYDVVRVTFTSPGPHPRRPPQGVFKSPTCLQKPSAKVAPGPELLSLTCLDSISMSFLPFSCIFVTFLRGYRQSQMLHCKMRGTLASEVFHATTLCLSRASEILIKYFKPRKRKWLAPSALYHFARSVVQDHLAYKNGLCLQTKCNCIAHQRCPWLQYYWVSPVYCRIAKILLYFLIITGGKFLNRNYLRKLSEMY